MAPETQHRDVYVYVAGPYSKGDVMDNIHRAIRAANWLMDAGYTPFVPHLTGIWHLVTPKPYWAWLEYDNKWLRKCDAVLRLDGESSGADKEVELALELGIPVYYDLLAFPELSLAGKQKEAVR